MEGLKDFDNRTNWVLALTAIYAVGAALQCVCALFSASILSTDDIAPSDLSAGGMLALLAGLGALIVLVAYVVAGIIFLILLYRACEQAMKFSAPFKCCSPGLAVGYWFIPFANLIMPHEVMSDLMRSSAESTGGRFKGMVVHIWWTAFVAKAVWGVVIFIMKPAHPQTPQELAQTELLVGIGGAIGFCAAVLFYKMLRDWRSMHLTALRGLEIATAP